MVISYSQLPLLRTPSHRELVSLLVRVHYSRNLFHSNVCNFYFARDLAALHIIGMSVIARCLQGKS